MDDALAMRLPAIWLNLKLNAEGDSMGRFE